MIINATNICEKITGIGKYSLSLSRYLLENWDYPFKLYINSNASHYFEESTHKEKIKIADRHISPDFHSKGHIYRTLWSNMLCLKNRKDLVFSTSPMESSIWHKRQIVTFHDIIPIIFPQYHKKQYHYFKFVYPAILKNAVRIITVSQNTRNLIADMYKIPEEKISVIYNGISGCYFDCKPNYEKQNYILYVGRLAATKNIDGIIKAFEILISRCKLDLKLKLVGGYMKLNSNIRPEVKKRIEIISNIPDEKKLISLYKNALLFVFPSFHEGFGIPPIEAMACGCPTVVSNRASLPEICGEASCYVDPYDVESIAEGMYNVASDKRLRKTLIEKGLKRATMFSVEKSAQQHIEVFKEVISV